MATVEWTVLEKLLLSQAVYKYGEDNWFQIARNLKHHVLLDRPSDYFNQKNCSLQYYLMVEDLDKEKRHSPKQDMPVVVQIARQLYSLRLEELKNAINEDEEKFLLLISEIDDIRAGKWDNQLLGLQKDQPLSTENTPVVESDANTSLSPLNTEETPTSNSNSDQQPVGELESEKHEEEKLSEEQAKLETDNLENEKRNVREKDLTPQAKEVETSEESFRSATEENTPVDESDLESQPSKKRLLDDDDLEEESDLKRQKIDREQYYSTDISQVTTPADITDAGFRDGTESIAESDSNAATPNAERRTYKKDDPRYKSWQKNINLLWREIANHKNGAMFMNPIKESIAPHYHDIVKRPMDLKTIKNRIRDGLINSTIEFERDVVLMLNNSLMYNKEGTEVYHLAREMLDDAVEKIKIFKNADTETSASSHTRAASMAAKERRKSIVPE